MVTKLYCCTCLFEIGLGFRNDRIDGVGRDVVEAVLFGGPRGVAEDADGGVSVACCGVSDPMKSSSH